MNPEASCGAKIERKKQFPVCLGGTVPASRETRFACCWGVWGSFISLNLLLYTQAPCAV